MRYLVLNLLVSTITAGSVLYLHRTRIPVRRLLIVLLFLLILTAIFDSLIIYSGIVAYTPQHIIGITIGKAPIEDFFYALVAAVFGPLIWDYYEHKK